MKLTCKKTLVMGISDITAITAGTEYEVLKDDGVCGVGYYILNDQNDTHHFTEDSRLEFFN